MLITRAVRSLEEDTECRALTGDLMLYNQAIDELVSSACTLETLRGALPASNSVSNTTNRLINLELKNVEHRTGISMENLTDTTRRTTSEMTDGITSKLNEIWKNILAFLKKAVDAASRLFSKLQQSSTETHEKAQEVIAELKVQAEDPKALAAPVERYPYTLSADQLAVLSMNGKVLENWTTDVPRAIQRLGDWLSVMFTQAEQQQAALYDTFRKTVEAPTADWSVLEKMVGGYLKHYHDNFINAPKLLGTHDWIWDGIPVGEADLVTNLEALRRCFKISSTDKEIANEVSPVKVDQLISALTVSLKWPRIDNRVVSDQMSKQVGELERLFNTSRNMNWSADQNMYARQLGRLIPGNLYTTLMVPLRYYISTTAAFVKTVQRIQKELAQ